MELVLQIAGYIIPAIIVFLATYAVLRAFLDRESKMRLIEFKQSKMRESLPIRLQAYERLTVFLERLALHNLLPRVRKGEMTTGEFRTSLISNIRMEYEHNISQQIYISTEAWAMIRAAKEEIISIINRNAMELLPELPGIELHKKIIAELAETEEDIITQKAINQLKKEVALLYDR